MFIPTTMHYIPNPSPQHLYELYGIKSCKLTFMLFILYFAIIATVILKSNKCQHLVSKIFDSIINNIFQVNLLTRLF